MSIITANQYATKVHEHKASLTLLNRAIAKGSIPSRVKLLAKPFEEIFGNLPQSIFERISNLFLHIYDIGRYTYSKAKGKISGKEYFKVVFGKFTQIIIFDPLSVLFLATETAIKVTALFIGIIILPKACAHMMKASPSIKLAEAYMLEKFWNFFAPKNNQQSQEVIIDFEEIGNFLDFDVVNKLSPAKDDKEQADTEFMKFRDKLSRYFESLDTLFSNRNTYPLWNELENKSTDIKKAFESFPHPNPATDALSSFTPTYISAIKSNPDLSSETLFTLLNQMQPVFTELYEWVRELNDQDKNNDMNAIIDLQTDVYKQRKIVFGGVRVTETVV